MEKLTLECGLSVGVLTADFFASMVTNLLISSRFKKLGFFSFNRDAQHLYDNSFAGSDDGCVEGVLKLSVPHSLKHTISCQSCTCELNVLKDSYFFHGRINCAAVTRHV